MGVEEEAVVAVGEEEKRKEEGEGTSISSSRLLLSLPWRLQRRRKFWGWD